MRLLRATQTRHGKASGLRPRSFIRGSAGRPFALEQERMVGSLGIGRTDTERVVRRC